MSRLEIFGVPGLPEVREGDDLAALIAAAPIAAARFAPADGDIVVVTSKIVSKAEGRVMVAADRTKAIEAETVRVVARRASPAAPAGETRIVETRQGLVL